MAWLSRVNFTASDVLSYTDLNNLGNDIRAWGGNVNGGAYTLSNVVLSASSGTMATVIGGTGTTSTLTLRSTSGVGTTGADIIFQTGNNGATEVMRLQNGGNVGIGTSSPDSKLQVGDGTAATTLTVYGNVSGSKNSYVRLRDFSGASIGLRAAVGGTETLVLEGGSGNSYFNGGGNVGIGTSSPSSLLTVRKSGTGDTLRLACGAGSAGDGPALMFFDADTSNAAQISTAKSAANTASLLFATANGGSPAERMRIDSSGNVGIGTSSVATSAKLEIAGTTGALLVPRLTTTERNALTAVNGMIIYNTTDNQMQGRINGAWVAM